MRLEYDEILKKVSDFITWRNLEDRIKDDLPKLEESHKEVLFANWDSLLNEAKNATSNVVATTNSVIENINKNLHSQPSCRIHSRFSS